MHGNLVPLRHIKDDLINQPPVKRKNCPFRISCLFSCTVLHPKKHLRTVIYLSALFLQHVWRWKRCLNTVCFLKMILDHKRNVFLRRKVSSYCLHSYSSRYGVNHKDAQRNLNAFLLVLKGNRIIKCVFWTFWGARPGTAQGNLLLLCHQTLYLQTSSFSGLPYFQVDHPLFLKFELI